MTKNYGRWNNASYYPNCNLIAGMSDEYSTEKILYGNTMEIQVRNYYNNDDMNIGSFEMHILLRVAASHGLTRGQLEKYLILQGLVISKHKLDERLYQLVKYGYLSIIMLRSTEDGKEIILYDNAERGMAVLKKNELPCQNPAEEYFSNGDLYRFIRTKIISNQIILSLLREHEGVRTFYFQREFEIDGNTPDNEAVIAPLYVQTENRYYVFEFVGNTKMGKGLFKEHMERMVRMRGLFPKNTVLVIVAETYTHMEMLAAEMLSYERRGLEMEILYSHDSEWFYDIPGHFYSMARAMGQTGLISVRMI